MGFQPQRPAGSPAVMLSVLELVASEYPGVLPFVVENLASSPARSVLMELASLFKVGSPAELAAVAVTAAQQLDRLERKRWTEPRDVFGEVALSSRALEAFAKRRVERFENLLGTVPPGLVRLDRKLKDAAGRARAAAQRAEVAR